MSDSSSVVIDNTHFYGYDFRHAGVSCFRHMFETCPSRAVYFRNMTVVLATRARQLNLSDCSFEDVGNSFINALAGRTSSVELLTFEGENAPEEENVRLLLRSGNVQKLTLPQLDGDIVMLPFSAKVDCLDYEIRSSSILDGDVQSLNIVANKLAFTIFEEGDAFPVEATLAFLRRLVTLGHFIELKVRFTFDDDEMEVEIPDCMVQEVICTAIANPKLQVLDLTLLNWKQHAETLLQGLEVHKGLRILKFNVDEDAFGSNYALLRQFLSDNRNVTVMNEDDEIYTDEADINQLYSLNRIYLGSADLVVIPLREIIVDSDRLEKNGFK
ncbi:hypothetical protein FisN_9Lh140 [Fistulifera solaris]|uniref:Uncharacterized protein n=1 Tax=Fistulifera solaris TaxID=1519565 RepID=A0A1Z5KL47_FISSO|nr:hypothetical protein FisN_9Lh140 [Fistulifera solaris]|eukprot:GAX26855.1 hypothetical protein FisN_9Lh140 [Fistulifera solaris]